MFARVTFSQVSPGVVDQGLEIVHGTIIPAAKQQKGFKGYMLLTDRAAGKSINITLWETEADRTASDQVSPYYQDVISKITALFTAAPVVENYYVDIFEE